VEACGVDVAADPHWAQAWDRLSERYAKRAGQAQTELAQLRGEVVRLHAEVAAEQLVAKKAQAEEANLRAQLADAAQNAEQARLEALHQLERTQQQLARAQAAATRLREEVKELADKLGIQEREAAQPFYSAPAAANPPDYRRVPGYPRSRAAEQPDAPAGRALRSGYEAPAPQAADSYPVPDDQEAPAPMAVPDDQEAPAPQAADSYPAAPVYGYRTAERQDLPDWHDPQDLPDWFTRTAKPSPEQDNGASLSVSPHS